MVGLCLSYKYLFFTPCRGEPSPPPEGIEREWLRTPSGELELLSAGPSSSAAPILFIHGGMRSAWVWNEFMLFLAERGVRLYALSLVLHDDQREPDGRRLPLASSLNLPYYSSSPSNGRPRRHDVQ